MSAVIPMKGGDEYDLLSKKSRKVHMCASKPGVCRKAKRSYNRRVRRYFKDVINASTI